MRIVAGNYGSRRLHAVPGMNTRPTTDKVKEAMFSMLGGRLAGAYVLDFYGGSGALAIEAVSRGIEHAIITEKYRPALTTIQQNIAVTKEPERFTLLNGDNRASMSRWVSQHPNAYFSLILLDPPYAKQQLINDIEWLINLDVVNQDTRIMCETDTHTELPEQIGIFELIRRKQYGQTMLHLYSVKPSLA